MKKLLDCIKQLEKEFDWINKFASFNSFIIRGGEYSLLRLTIQNSRQISWVPTLKNYITRLQNK